MRLQLKNPNQVTLSLNCLLKSQLFVIMMNPNLQQIYVPEKPL